MPCSWATKRKVISCMVLNKYNNCHLPLNPSPAQSDEFSFIKVQDVVTSTSAVHTRPIARYGV